MTVRTQLHDGEDMVMATMRKHIRDFTWCWEFLYSTVPFYEVVGRSIDSRFLIEPIHEIIPTNSSSQR